MGAADSIIITPATIGPPNSAEIAANAPAVASTLVSFSASRANEVRATATIEPSATTGASGPSTSPNPSVPAAARTMPGA